MSYNFSTWRALGGPRPRPRPPSAASRKSSTASERPFSASGGGFGGLLGGPRPSSAASRKSSVVSERFYSTLAAGTDSKVGFTFNSNFSMISISMCLLHCYARHIRKYIFLQPQDTVIAKKISEEGQHPEYLEGDGNTDRLRASEYPREEKQVTITTGWLSARSRC